MKYILSVLLFVSMTAFYTPLPGIYDYDIVLADGQTHSLSEYQGRKMMIVILPATRTTEDSAYFSRIDSIGSANTGQLTVIAVPSYEDGFTDDSTAGLLQWYQRILDSNVVVTQGMHTHLAVPEQHALFSWLTHASVNGHFDEDIAGPGQMYFINETGELYGMFMPDSKWSDSVISQMLQ